MMTTEKSDLIERQLTLQDRCDSCGAQAFVLVKLVSGELMFCGHHFNQHEAGLKMASYDIVDEREYIKEN
jgi:hypothetical protein